MGSGLEVWAGLGGFARGLLGLGWGWVVLDWVGGGVELGVC